MGCGVSSLVNTFHPGDATQVSLTPDLGNGLNVIKVMPESSVKFGAYEVGGSVLVTACL